VSEGDLLPKQEFQEDPNARPLPWWRRWLGRDRTAGTVAADVMTSPALTIGPDESVVAAARLMERHRVSRGNHQHLSTTAQDALRCRGLATRTP
jgi:hypothetical protein